jgi:drug/metabolite transporter (DMT)-like permease
MSRKGLLLFLACGIAWGIPYFFIKVAAAEFSPAMVIFARVFFGSLALVPLAIKSGAFVSALKAWKASLAFAVLEMAVPWLLITVAEHGHINSGLAGLLIATVPFFAMAITYYYLGDKSAVHKKNVLGLAIGFVGIFLLVGIDAFTQNLEIVWVGAVILAAVGYAFAPAMVDKNAPNVPRIGTISVSMLIVAAIYAVPAFLNPLAEGVTAPTFEGWASLVILGVVCSAVAFVLFFKLMNEIGLSRASLITYLNTAVAILLGVLFASEPFTIGMWVGFPLVAVGSFLASRRHA